MTKEFQLEKIISGTNIGTNNTVYKVGTPVELCSNTGKTPIRIDKEMCQVSCYHTGTGPVLMGVVVHMSDETGATFDGASAISEGVTTIDALQGLMNQWKDNVFMTDFQLVGTGYDESLIWVTNLEADTRRILNPSQKLYVSVFAIPMTTESSKQACAIIDNIVWYSPAAQ